MSLSIPLRLPGRRQRRWLVTVVTASALAGTVMAPSAVAAAAPQDQSTTFFAWGTDYNGQIGNGTTTDEYTPQPISLPGGVAPVEVSVGYQFDLALGADGQVYSWGDDANEELGDTTGVARGTPQAISLPGGLPAVSIAAGNNYGLAVGADGQVYWWGTQRGDGQGPQQLPTLVPLPGGDTARSVEIFNTVSVAIGVDGKVFVWGQNYADTLGNASSQDQITPEQFVLPGGDGVASVAFGEGFGLAIGTDGKLFSWGEWSTYGVLGNGGTAPVETPTQISLPGGVPPISVATGGLDAMAIGADGRVYTWGTQTNGELGKGTTGYATQLSPEAITLPGGVLAASIGASFGSPSASFAVGQNGVLYTWGNNGLGLIGDGTTTSSPTPKAVAIPGNPPIGTVAAGPYVMLAIPGSAAPSQLPPKFLSQAAALDTLSGAVYSAYFPATGAPAYSLVGAPSWLTITATGAVVGTPPPGTTSFAYSVAADNAAGHVQAGPFAVAVQAAVSVTGTVVYADSAATPVSGAAVDACVTGVAECQQATTAGNGIYSVTVPAGASVVLTAYPLPGTTNTTASTAPLQASPGGLQNVTITLGGIAPLPGRLLVAGTPNPTLYWGRSTPASLAGCQGGLGLVTVVGQNAQTGQYQASFAPLTETSFGSGQYTGQIPSQTPVHGPVEIDSSDTCLPHDTALLPDVGTQGTSVLVTGTGLTAAAGVSFGGVPATSFTVLDDGDIQAVAPPGTGTVAVTAQTAAGSVTAGQYTYMAVTAVTPAGGPQSGGTAVVITGTGLSSASTVQFGSTGTAFTQVSDTEIDAVSPPGSGTQDITVQSSYGQSTPTGLADQFAYQSAGSATGLAHKAATSAARSHGSPTPATASTLRAELTSADASGVSFTQVLDYIDKYLQQVPSFNFPGSNYVSFLQTISSAAQLILHPSCATGKQATINATLLALQGPIRAFGGALAAAADVGIPVLLAETPVTAAAIPAVEAFLATPGGQIALGVAGSLVANWLAKQAVTAAATIAFSIACPGTSTHNAFIDPSGTVLDTNGNPIAGATATILRADTAAGPFSPLSAAAAGIRPAVNPQTTAADGVFHWDVFSGWYEIQVSAPGCTDPQSPGQSTVTIGPYPVPPPQVGLAVIMACANQSPPPTPTVTALGTTTGPAAGGTTVSVSGSGFTPASTVDFGSTAATAVTFVSPRELTVETPPGFGMVDVTVHNGAATSATSSVDLYFFGSPPAVTGLSATSGPASGGTNVTVTGTGLTAATEVYFGNLPATSFTVTSDTQIQATAPAEPAATVDVQITTPAGTSAHTSADQFTYQPVAPAFTADSPPATAIAGQPYSYTYTATGIPTPTFSLGSGSLPPGLALNQATGVLSGTATTVGIYTFAIAAANKAGPPVLSPPTTLTVVAATGPTTAGQAKTTGANTVTAKLTTAQSGDLIVAFVAGDGPRDALQQATVTGAGLTWTLLTRTNAQLGTAEIWTARADRPLSSAAISATLAHSGYGEALTILAFANTPGIGTTLSASAGAGAPAATSTTTAPNSLVLAVGNDWTASIPRTPGPGQSLITQSTDKAGDTYWVQRQNAATPTTGTPVTINDTAPTNDRWNLSLIEIL